MWAPSRVHRAGAGATAVPLGPAVAVGGSLGRADRVWVGRLLGLGWSWLGVGRGFCAVSYTHLRAHET